VIRPDRDTRDDDLVRTPTTVRDHRRLELVYGSDVYRNLELNIAQGQARTIPARPPETGFADRAWTRARVLRSRGPTPPELNPVRMPSGFDYCQGQAPSPHALPDGRPYLAVSTLNKRVAAGSSASPH
jgi:hypothetical protein